MKALISAEQAARIVGVNSQTIMKWARAGKIPHIRVNRWVRFDRDAITVWVKQGGMNGVAAPAGNGDAPPLQVPLNLADVVAGGTGKPPEKKKVRPYERWLPKTDDAEQFAHAFEHVWGLKHDGDLMSTNDVMDELHRRGITLKDGRLATSVVRHYEATGHITRTTDMVPSKNSNYLVTVWRVNKPPRPPRP